MNSSVDEYKSVGECGAYCNAVLANEAKRDTICSPRVTTIIPSSPIHITTPPPVMIPSTNTIREMPNTSFITMLESLAGAATRIKMVEEPIDYEHKANIDMNKEPGLPYFPNKPTSLCFYPLYIPKADNNNKRP